MKLQKLLCTNLQDYMSNKFHILQLLDHYHGKFAAHYKKIKEKPDSICFTKEYRKCIKSYKKSFYLPADAAQGL